MGKTRYYVYPAGISGLLLGEMIAQVVRGGGGDCEIIYIDDSVKGATLEDYKQEILEGGFIVNLANNKANGGNDKTILVLKEKLKACGIPYHEEAFLEYTLKMIGIISKSLEAFGENVVGIELCGIANDKHIGYLDTYLLEHSKINLLYLCATYDSLKNLSKRLEESLFKHRVYAVCFPLEHTQKLSFLKVLCKTSILSPKNKNVPTIYLGHALSDWSKVDMERYYGDKIDYLSVGLREFAPKNLSTIKIIKSGYLGFDLVQKEIDFKNKKDSVFFAPYNQEEFFQFLPFIKQVLAKYRVIYRHRGFFEGKHLWDRANEVLEELKKDSNFFVDDSWSISPLSYSRSFAFVGGITTAVNTFPILALSPSVSDNAALNLNLGVRVDFSQVDLMEVIKEIFCHQEQWQKKLLEYRKENIYHFGYASEVMGEFVISKFLESR